MKTEPLGPAAIERAPPCVNQQPRVEPSGAKDAMLAPPRIQIAPSVANVIEPAIMGRSLNLSPLVVIVSLMVWGTIWGVVGMFLCVPIMVVLLIVFAHFETTRPVAVLLSATGRIPEPGGRSAD